MDTFLTVVVVVAIVAAVVWWLRRRNRPAPVEDEWVLPPENGGVRSAPAPQVFDRESLLNRDRRLDVSGWDDSADADETEDPYSGGVGDAPPVLDRDVLRRGKDADAGAAEDGPHQ